MSFLSNGSDELRDEFIQSFKIRHIWVQILLALLVLAYLPLALELFMYLTKPNLFIAGDPFDPTVGQMSPPLSFVVVVMAILLLGPVPFLVFFGLLVDSLALRGAGRHCHPGRVVLWLRRFKSTDDSYLGFQRVFEQACLGLIVPVTMYDASLAWPPPQLIAHSPVTSSAALSYKSILKIWFGLAIFALLTSDFWLYLLWPVTGSLPTSLPSLNSIDDLKNFKPVVDPQLSILSQQCASSGVILLVGIGILALVLRYRRIGKRIEFGLLRAAESLTGLRFLTEVSGAEVDSFLERIAKGKQLSTGVHVIRCGEKEWQPVVLKLLKRADRVILTGDDLGQAMRWEIEEVRAHVASDKILIPVFIPAPKHRSRQVENAIELIENHGIAALMHRYFGDAALGTALSGSAMVIDVDQAETALRSWLKT